MKKLLKDRLLAALPWSLWGPVYRAVAARSASARAFRRHRVGEHSYIDPSVQIIGCDQVRIGRGSTLSQGCWLNVNHRDEAVDRITIGDYCHLGRNNFLSCGPSIVIQDYGFTGLDCQLLGCGHDTASPRVPYIRAGLTVGKPIFIGYNVWLATAVTVMPGVVIGRGSVVGAGSLVTRSIAPFSIAHGTPCTVTRRFDFKNDCWIDAAQWRDELDAYLPSADDYIAELRRHDGDPSPSLLAASRRFGWI